MITFKSTSVTLMIYINAGLPLRRTDYSKGAREQHQCYFCDWREGEYYNDVDLLRWIGETSTRQHTQGIGFVQRLQKHTRYHP